jgi:protein gp37
MGDSSAIEWTDATWNPLRGCSRVSEGCRHCYAEGVARRFAGPGQPYEGLVRLDASGRPKAQWNGVVRMVPEHLGDPLRWTRPRRVFVNSMSDLFHESLEFEQIASVFEVMAMSPDHTFQVLTKRPERARGFFAWVARHAELDRIDEGDVVFARNAGLLADDVRERRVEALTLDSADVVVEWPLANVWLGVSVEHQAAADERIPVLLGTPAALRWVSYEPALGPVDFTRITWGNGDFLDALRRDSYRGGLDSDRLDWIVVGGESGPGARPFDVAWARSTIEQCRVAAVPVFVKQLGARPYESVSEATRGMGGVGLALRDRKGGDMAEWPEDLRVREWPHG